MKKQAFAALGCATVMAFGLMGCNTNIPKDNKAAEYVDPITGYTTKTTKNGTRFYESDNGAVFEGTMPWRNAENAENNLKQGVKNAEKKLGKNLEKAGRAIENQADRMY